MGVAIGGILILGISFLPSIIAASRHSKRGGGIFVVNVFLGWTLIGWVIALAWAASSDIEEEGHGNQPVPTTSPTPHKAAISVADGLSKLAQLQKDGVIDAEEFEAQKKAVLSHAHQ